MGLFDIFKGKSKTTTTSNPDDPEFSRLVAADAGKGRVDLMMLDPESGSRARFPDLDFLLRDTHWFQAVRKTLQNSGAPDDNIPVVEHLTNDVVQVFGLDAGDRYTILSPADLRRYGMGLQITRAGALARLRQAVPDLLIEGGSGRFRVSYPENPDLSASFMLVHGDWLDPNELNGDPVFAVGRRISLHACGSRDRESLEGMREIAQVMYAESVNDPYGNGKPLTKELLTMKDDKLVPFR
ncbi:MAG: hypothetical protein AAF735_07040 [Myxococcota bacterium]